MRKFLIAFLLLAFALSAAMADPLTLLPDLTDTVYWPEGSDAESAFYAYSYAYPQVAGEGEAEQAINKTYIDEVADKLEFDFPRRAGDITDDSILSSTDIRYRITANDGELFSVVFITDSTIDGDRNVRVKANVFSIITTKSGHMVTLPYLLGIIEEDSDDDWLREHQTERADEIIRMLILDEIERRRGDGEPIPENIDEEAISVLFNPEEDFYYDEETGYVVFFLQPFLNGEGMEPDDFYTFAFDFDEILDEM